MFTYIYSLPHSSAKLALRVHKTAEAASLEAALAYRRAADNPTGTSADTQIISLQALAEGRIAVDHAAAASEPIFQTNYQMLKEDLDDRAALTHAIAITSERAVKAVNCLTRATGLWAASQATLWTVRQQRTVIEKLVLRLL